jgi:hypothetical protein
MDYSLQGARRQARLDWDALEKRNRRAQVIPRRIFFGAVIALIAYFGWTYLA